MFELGLSIATCFNGLNYRVAKNGWENFYGKNNNFGSDIIASLNKKKIRIN